MKGRKKRVFRASWGLSYSIFVELFTLARKVCRSKRTGQKTSHCKSRTFSLETSTVIKLNNCNMRVLLLLTRGLTVALTQKKVSLRLMYFLQESHRKSISCKNLARFLQEIFFLSGSCKKCIFCQNLARFIFFVKILQESCKNCICFQPGTEQYIINNIKYYQTPALISNSQLRLRVRPHENNKTLTKLQDVYSPLMGVYFTEYFPFKKGFNGLADMLLI